MNKNKEPQYYSIKALFSSYDYVIPIYQRNYEWSESQIHNLFKMLEDNN